MSQLITAAKWLTEAESPKELGDSLRNLAPAATHPLAAALVAC